MTQSIRQLFEQSIRDRVFSAAAAGVSVAGEQEAVFAGETCFPELGTPRSLTAQTPFDLASLTKFMVTAPLLWHALSTSACRADEPVSRWLPDWCGRDGVSLGMLANHTSGLPAWGPVFESVGSPQEMREAVLATPRRAAPGAQHVYSDFGYMLLGFALERMLGAPLDALFSEIVAAPLGLSARFVRADEEPLDAVHTEEGYAVGRVHDENAAALGGVAGHAGLFGTVEDVLAFGEAVLRADGGKLCSWPIAPAVVRWALSASHGTLGSHLLGADTPSGPNSNAGAVLARAPLGVTVGHLGFTGTAVWIDRSRALVSTLLTNRVHPSRDNDRIRAVRQQVADLHAGTVSPTRALFPACPQLIGPTRRRQFRRRRQRDVAMAAARSAGALALRMASAPMAVEHKGTVDLVTEADLAAEGLILGTLRAAFPDYGVLAEESGGGGLGSHVWIVDPIDGTTNYSHGFPHFCVCIALEVDGQLELGVTYDPSRDELFWAERGQGAWCNANRLSVSSATQIHRALAVTGFPYDRQTNPDNNANYFAEMMRHVQGVRRVGSAGLDLAWIAAGRLDVYWELRLKPWDVSAGLLLVEEAGGRITDLDGAAFDRARGDIVATCGGGVHEQVLAALSTLRPASATPSA